MWSACLLFAVKSRIFQFLIICQQNCEIVPLSKMIHILLIVGLLHLPSFGLTLVPCSGNVTKLQLCFFGFEYEKGMPSMRPLNLLTSVTVFSISEVEQDQI